MAASPSLIGRASTSWVETCPPAQGCLRPPEEWGTGSHPRYGPHGERRITISKDPRTHLFNYTSAAARGGSHCSVFNRLRTLYPGTRCPDAFSIPKIPIFPPSGVIGKWPLSAIWEAQSSALFVPSVVLLEPLAGRTSGVLGNRVRRINASAGVWRRLLFGLRLRPTRGERGLPPRYR